MQGEDNVLTTHNVSVKTPSYKTPVSIHFLGDVHSDSPNCDRSALKSSLAEIKAKDAAGLPYLVVLMGDYTDRCSSSERAAIARSSLHESTQATMDRDALRDVTWFLDAIWFAKDHIVGVIQGNHYWRFMTGDLAGKSSDMYMAEKLGTRWLGFLSYIRVDIEIGRSGSHTAIDIVACHGSKAGGKLAGTSINQIGDLKAVFPDAHIYAMGHNHQAGAVATSALFAKPIKGNALAGGIDIQERKQILIRTGSYLRAYEQDVPSYAVRALYKPATLGHAEAIVKVSRVSNGDGGTRMTHDIKAVI